MTDKKDVRHVFTFIILLISMFGSALDTWVGASEADFRGARESMTRAYEKCPAGLTTELVGSTVHVDHSSMDGASDSTFDHHCHLGHCSFVLTNSLNVGTLTPTNSSPFIRSNILPSDLASYIPRPPSEPALA